jgi:hypothetical protein
MDFKLGDLFPCCDLCQFEEVVAKVNDQDKDRLEYVRSEGNN